LQGVRESTAIGFRKDNEIRCLQVGAKSSHHRPKSGKIDLFEVGAGGAEVLEETEEMIGSSPNRNRGETLSVRKVLIGEQLLRGQGKQQAQMFACGEPDLVFSQQKRAEIGWREKLQTESGEAGLKHAPFEGLGLAAGRHDDERAALAPPSLRGGLLQPISRRAVPPCFRR
jgi:hypothetical protein